jgi:hypothetical protein
MQNLYWQKPAKRKTCQIHAQAQEHGIAETQPIAGNEIQQKAFNYPNQDFGNEQGNEIVLKEQVQHKPQKGLCDQVPANACEQDRSERFPAPNGIYNDDNPLDDDRDEKGGDQFLAKRRRSKTINPMTRPTPANTQAYTTNLVTTYGEGLRLNCALTSKSSGRTVTVYFELKPAVLKTLL